MSASPERFERIAIFGMGLLGGSVAKAVRARGVAREVIGVTRREETARALEAAGLVDRAILDPADGVAEADLVVLCNPITFMPGVLDRAAPHLSPGTVVTDVGSVKGPLAETLPGRLPSGVCYVGSHPMAGSHQTGFEHARADLFQGRPCVVTATAETDENAAGRVAAFWESLGARIFRRDPTLHDDEVAWISHAPHAIAYAFAHALRDSPGPASDLRGPGFRDFTRIAGADVEMWADILLANRKALAGPLEATALALTALAEAVSAGDSETVHQLLATARETLGVDGEGNAPSEG